MTPMGVYCNGKIKGSSPTDLEKLYEYFTTSNLNFDAVALGEGWKILDVRENFVILQRNGSVVYATAPVS